MCLSEVKKIYKRPRKKEVTVYKVFETRGRDVYGENYGFNTPRPINKWLHEKDFRLYGYMLKRVIQITSRKRYPFGFHGFITYKGALEWSNGEESGIRKCKFRDVVARGIQNEHVCLIAKEMKILRGKV